MARHLTTGERSKIERLYLSGTKPSEIAQKFGLKPASVRQLLHRAKLTQKREEIDEVKREALLEVLARKREEYAGDYEDMLDDFAAGLRIDAKKLRDSWELVQDAAGASSLMRAKNLLQDRAGRFFGLDKEADAAPSRGLNFFVLAPRVDPVKAAKPVEPAESTGTKQCVPSLLPTTP